MAWTNDIADAEAICEAVSRPNMRFVPIKTVGQQAILSLHRVRQVLVKARTAQSNQIHGLLAEFCLILPKGVGQIAQRIPGILEDADNGLPGKFRQLIARLLAHFNDLHRQVLELEARIRHGIAITRPARDWPKCSESVRSPPPRWWPRSAKAGTSATAGS